MKKLYILRHAKSAYPENTDDHSRPLNKRGENSCRLIASYMKENNIGPEVILSSDAMRTKQTTKNILKILGSDVKPEFSEKLYLATAGEILKVISKVESSVNSLMIVSHNPGVENLVSLITGGGDKDSMNRLRVKYPTAGLSCLKIDIDNWEYINPSQAYLEGFYNTKNVRIIDLLFTSFTEYFCSNSNMSCAKFCCNFEIRTHSHA